MIFCRSRKPEVGVKGVFAGLDSALSKAENLSAFGFFAGERLDEFLHCRRQHATFAMQDSERPSEPGAVECNRCEGALSDLLSDGCLWCDRDPRIDFDGAFNCFDVVEFHYGLDLDFVFAKNLVDRFARGNVGIEADKFIVCKCVNFDDRLIRERMIGMANSY